MAAPTGETQGRRHRRCMTAEAALGLAALSIYDCDQILTKPEAMDPRKSARNSEKAGCRPEMAVSEPAGSTAVSATTVRERSGVPRRCNWMSMIGALPLSVK